MGATELQIFVSLVVVLGAAFVALICDFLKGSNERLREANLELRVRQDHHTVRTAPPVHAVAAHASAAEAAGVAAEAEHALARRVIAAHRHIRPESAAAAPGAEALAGSRRHPRRTRAQDRAPQLDDWAKELMERQIPLSAGAPVPAAQDAVQATPPVTAEQSGLAPAIPAFAVAPGAEPAPAGLTPLKESAAVTPATAETGELELPLGMAPVPAAPALQLKVEAPGSLECEPAMAGLAGLEMPARGLGSWTPAQLPATALAGEPERAWPSTGSVAGAGLPLAGTASLPGSLPVLRLAPPAMIPGAAIRPEEAPQIPTAVDAPAAGPPMAQGARLEVGLPALHESLVRVAAEPVAAIPGVPTMPRLALSAPRLTPGEAGLSPILPGFPLRGKGRAGVAVTPAFISSSPAAPVSSAPALHELEPCTAQTFAECGPAPVRRGAAVKAWALAPFIGGAAPAVPAHGLALDSTLPDAVAAAVPPAESGVEEAEAPVVRIRVLREDSLIAPEEPVAEPEPAVAAGFTQLQDLFAGPAETEEPAAPMPAGPVEQPISVLDSQAGLLPPAEKGKPAPAWSTEPAIPRDKVIELPLHPLATQSVRTMPPSALLDVPQGWHDARTLQHLAAAPLPFEGLVACVSVTDYARLVQEYGAGRCEEAVNSLGLALETLAEGSGFLCRASDEEIVILFPRLHASEHSARVRLLAEILWDFQLRTLSLVPVLCGWGASEALREPLAVPLARARSQMSESQRFRKGGSSVLSRFRRRVVNG